MFISALAMTQQQAILGAFLFMVPAMLLSGFATPIDNMPTWLQPVTLVNPLRYFLVIVNGVFLRDLPIGGSRQRHRSARVHRGGHAQRRRLLFRRRLE